MLKFGTSGKESRRKYQFQILCAYTYQRIPVFVFLCLYTHVCMHTHTHTEIIFRNILTFPFKIEYCFQSKSESHFFADCVRDFCSSSQLAFSIRGKKRICLTS